MIIDHSVYYNGYSLIVKKKKNNETQTEIKI